MTGTWRVGGGVLSMALAVLVSCGTTREHEAVSSDEPTARGPAKASTTVTESPRAAARIAELQERFEVSGAPVLRRGVATSFSRGEGRRLQAVLPATATRGVSRPANVELPANAAGESRLEDRGSHVRVGFRLAGAKAADVAVASGYALYAGALDGADLVHRVHAEGTEDFVVFESRPAREELRYDVDVTGVPGLRLVGNTLEFLDRRGSPALRVAPPYVLDAHGVEHAANLEISGCAVDMNPAPPWGRAVTAPGAASCNVVVTWSGRDVAYPAVVDPAWTTTGSMSTVRLVHSATLLASGLVLVAGGGTSGFGIGQTNPQSTAELYDPAAGTFAATGSMGTARIWHSATILASGKVLVAGGYTGAAIAATAELFDPDLGTFTPTGSLGTARQRHTASVLASGKVLLAGGGGTLFASAELYDPVAETFSPTGSLVTGRFFHTASVLPSGKVLVAGGASNPGVYVAAAELYDPGVGTFAATGSMITARQSHTASVLGSGKVLIAGGVGVALQASAELYDPGFGGFAATGSMATARQTHTASVLPSGWVLVAGGCGFAVGTTTATAELYDPSARKFTAASSMTFKRQAHSATVLASGAVLVAGGGEGNPYQATAELLTPLGAGGGPCTLGGDCASGACNDGVCCNGPCSGTCMTCTAGTGACAVVVGADDPDTCTGTNTCDAAGTCKQKNGRGCPGGAATCASGNCVDGICCDTPCSGGCDRCNITPGTCTNAPKGDPGQNPSCAGFVCDGLGPACPSSCTNTSDCVTTYTCASDGKCKKKDGELCPGGAATCASGNCVDGYCCNAPCDGGCDRCNASPGLCTNVGFGVSGQNPSCGNYSCDGVSGACPTTCTSDGHCAPAFYCSAAGVCVAQKPQASACNPTTDCKVTGCRVCDGACVGGICCVTDCAADAPETCGNAGACDAAGNCTKHPKGTACGPAPSCAAETPGGPLVQIRASACDGAGRCKTPPAEHCAEGYLCGASACNTTCTKDADCALGYACSVATSKCVRAGVGASCDGDHTATGGDGTTHDCSPYKCESNGTCRASCATVNDCVAPTICDANGKCVGSSSESTSDGGCSVVSMKPSGGDVPWQSAWVTAVAGLALLRRRRTGTPC